MRLTLIKSAIRPDPYQDLGEHTFTYALLPHAGGWFEGNTVREAWQLNNPLAYTAGQPVHPQLSLFHTDAAYVMVDAVKKAEDSGQVVLRFHEFAGSRGTVEFASGLPIRSWQECDLLERPFGEKSTEPAIRLSVTPYEIKTVLVEF